MLEKVRMTVLASGSRGNSAVISAAGTSILVDAGLSCRELLRRMALAGQEPADLDAILITHEHLDHVAGLAVLARKLQIPVFFTEPTHRAWVRMLRPRATMTYAKWLEHVQREKQARAAAALPSQPMHAPAHTLAAAATTAVAEPEPGVAEPEPGVAEPEPRVAEPEPGVAEPEPAELQDGGAEALTGLAALGEAEPCEPEATRTTVKADPAYLPAVEYFRAGHAFRIGAIDVSPFTIPHDAADPCGFVFHAPSESIRMAVVTDLGYIPPNVKLALRHVDVLLLESNHDVEMLKDGPYPWSVKQRVLSRVGHLSNHAAAEFLLRDYDGGAHTVVLGHLSEQNNLPELARMAAEQAIGNRMTLLGNRIVLAAQDAPLAPICL
jgi:phosphoribosyl 1,2-cyclic phosphodiesterase